CRRRLRRPETGRPAAARPGTSTKLRCPIPTTGPGSDGPHGKPTARSLGADAAQSGVVFSAVEGFVEGHVGARVQSTHQLSSSPSGSRGIRPNAVVRWIEIGPVSDGFAES